MKKTVMIVCGVIVLALLCGCGTKEQSDMDKVNGKTVTVVNEITDADVWILAQTEENLKTTLWGAATAPDVKAGVSASAPLCEPGDNGLYIFRMIDVDGYYYSCDGIALESGWILRISEDGSHAVALTIEDENGNTTQTCEVFSAKL